MAKIIIDNETGRILDEAIHALPRHSQRMAAYEAALDALLDIRNAPEPGGPWYDAPVSVRIENMIEAKYNNWDAATVEGVFYIGG